MKKTTSLGLILFIFLGAVIGYFYFRADRQESSMNSQGNNLVDREEGNNEKSNIKIIAVGDSLTAGYDLPLADSYPKILEEKLLKAGVKVEVVNAGVSGETTAGLLERAQFISEQNPDILLITTGGNDAFRNLPLKNTKENIIKALKIFKQNIKANNIYLLQIEATANLGLKYRNEFNGIYKEVASSEKVNLVPFVVKEVFLDQSKMLSDGIHPNKEGYGYIVDKFIFPALSKKKIDKNLAD